MISKTHTKDFCEKNWSYIRQISKKKESFPASSQNRNGFLRLFTFISDLQPNFNKYILVDDCHFGYNIKLKKRKKETLMLVVTLLTFNGAFHYSQCVFQWRIFAKFLPKKYDFDLHKGFLMGKIKIQICQIFKIFLLIFFFSNCYIYMISSVGSQEYKRIFYFIFGSYFHIQYVAKFELNYFVNNHHFGYIPNTLKSLSSQSIYTQIV